MSNEFKNFSLQIPTIELADNSSLIKKLDELTGKPSSLGISETTQWSITGLSLALKAVLIVHENSPSGNLISHRLISDGYSYLEYGDFTETEFFK